MLAGTAESGTPPVWGGRKVVLVAVVRCSPAAAVSPHGDQRGHRLIGGAQ
jgi:hypothetical protein